VHSKSVIFLETATKKVELVRDIRHLLEPYGFMAIVLVWKQ